MRGVNKKQNMSHLTSLQSQQCLQIGGRGGGGASVACNPRHRNVKLDFFLKVICEFKVLFHS